MCFIKDVVKFASKGKPDIVRNLIANWKGTNRFCKNHSLYM